MSTKTILTSLIKLMLLMFSLASTASTVGFNKIFVVGDSLSDTGNIFSLLRGATAKSPYTELIPSAAYESQRLSNGPVWVEYFASKLDMNVQASLTGGTGYAFAGARTGPLTGLSTSPIPTLIDQAQAIVNLPGKLSANALYVVWGGGNDIRDAVASNDPTQAGVIVNDSINNLGMVISSLATEGATKFLVPNLPNFGQLPIARNFGPAAENFFAQISTEFNKNLALLLSNLENNLDIDITELNVEQELENIIANPGDLGLENVIDHCIILGDGSCSNPDGYLFWDGIHPTTAGHAIIGDRAFAAIIPVPASIPLFVTAMSLLALVSNRKKLG